MLNLTRQIALRSAVPRAPAVNYIAKRTIITLKDHKYTAHATATGLGRNGTVESDGLKLKLALPKELGGTGKGENPEQLFAMGYASCLLGAIQAMAGRMGKPESAKNAVVHTSVHIGQPTGAQGGFGLAVDIKVENVDQDVLDAGHKFCPYSRALQDGIEIKVSKA